MILRDLLEMYVANTRLHMGWKLFYRSEMQIMSC